MPASPFMKPCLCTSTPVFNISEFPLPGKYLKFTPPFKIGGVRTTLLYTQAMLIQILIDVQYLQKLAFSFEQSKSFLLRFLPRIKKFLLGKVSYLPTVGTSSPPLLNTIWKTLIYKDWLNLILFYVQLLTHLLHTRMFLVTFFWYKHLRNKLKSTHHG